jgi:hypothetical protein
LVLLVPGGIIFYREGKQADDAQSIFLLVCTGHPRKTDVRRFFVMISNNPDIGGKLWLISVKPGSDRSMKSATDMPAKRLP